jgi:hypothetical protein
MTAQYELTKRFTAEFSIRAFIDRHPAETLDRLRLWATDDNVHVRRLVSEGTRPRLPWAPRLRRFQDDPAPVIELLDLLKDDDHDGMATPTHAHLAKDIDPDLVIISSPMTRPGRRMTAGYARRNLAAEVATLRSRGIQAVVVEPDETTADLAKGYPRRNGHHAPEIETRSARLAMGAIEAAQIVPALNSD